MLFDMTANSNSRKIMLLNPDYPKDVTLKNTDGIATFSAVIAKKGRPDEYVYQWYVNGVAATGATRETYSRNVSGDKGKYSVWCEVSNKAGTVRTREATLTVKKLPVLHGSYPENVSVAVASPVTFRAAIAEDGYPAIYTYQWYVNGVPVSGATSPVWTDIASPVGVRDVCCFVTNEAGSLQTRTATLSVSAKDFFSNGTFHYGGSYEWGGNSDTLQECGIENGHWYLKVDGGGHFAATWGTAVVDLTGISNVIFGVALTHTTGHTDTQESIEKGIGWGRMGVVQTDKLATTIFDAGVSIRLFSDESYREYGVDVSHLNGIFAIKFVIDRTTQQHNQDYLYIRSIRFE